MRKFIFLLLSIFVLTSISVKVNASNTEDDDTPTGTVTAVDSVVVNNFKYKFSGDSASVAYVGKGLTVTFPASVTHAGKTYTVTQVDGAPGNNFITTVTIPSGVNKLADNAFRDCKKLTTVNLPKTSISVGGAFRGCPLLSKVTNYNMTWSSGPNSDVQSFLCTFFNSPKMLDALCTQLLAKYPDLSAFIKYNLFEDDYRCDYLINDIKASLVIGKRLLVKQAAQGNEDAMIAICNRFLKRYPKSKLITPAEYFKYAKLLIPKNPAFGYYFTGLAYEKGYGVTPSRRQAHYYYGKGRELNDSDCDNGYWRTI